MGIETNRLFAEARELLTLVADPQAALPAADVVRRASEIERLARSVKDRMRN